MAAAEFALQQQVEILYTDHHGWLRGLLRRTLGNAFDAADLAHDVYLQLLRTGRVPPADERRRHLTQIANGLVIDLYRRRRVEAAYLEALALLLCKLDGMAYRDIAAELGVSVSSVEKYIAAGLLACYQALHGAVC